MTDQELTILLTFLTGGVLVGWVGSILDQLTDYIRRR